MNSLNEYGEFFLKLNLSELSVREGDFSLVLKKAPAEAGASVLREEKVMAETSTAETPLAAPSPAPASAAAGTPVKAPILGIFGELTGNRSPIKEGDRVKRGDALCTIEAMKMLNEVVATTEGTVVKICAKPGDLVEYDQELFIIRKEA